MCRDLLVYAVNDDGEQDPYNGTTGVWVDYEFARIVVVLKWK